MNSYAPPPSAPQPGAEDILASYREKILFRFAVVGVMFLAPFVVYALWQQTWSIGVPGVLIEAILFSIALAIHRGRPLPVPPVIVFLPMLFTIVAAIQARGFVGVVWAYPTLLMAHFILSRRSANLVSAIIILVITPVTLSVFDPAVVLRLFVTLVLTVVFANIFNSLIMRLQQRLQELAIVDPLTGAYNRRHMEAYIREVIAQQARERAGASLLLLDIDRFKAINDELGHDTGDQVLREVVAILNAHLRKQDRLFRLGGEEFVVLLPQTDHAAALRVAEKLRAAVAESALLDARQVTISIGGSELQPGESLEAWFRRCDRALYRAKDTGRNRVVMSNDLQPDALA